MWTNSNQALQLSATIEALGKHKEDESQIKKVSKAAAASAKASRKKKVDEKQAATKHDLSQLTSLLDAGPAKGKKHSALELKAFSTNVLQGKYPAVKHAKRMDVVVPYLLAVSAKMYSAECDAVTAATFVRNDMAEGREGREGG